jgi:hypothetical protein
VWCAPIAFKLDERRSNKLPAIKQFRKINLIMGWDVHLAFGKKKIVAL